MISRDMFYDLVNEVYAASLFVISSFLCIDVAQSFFPHIDRIDIPSSMINSRRPRTNIDRVNVQRLLHKARAIVERRATVQLRRRHPEPLLRVDPHGVDPEEALVADEDGHRAVWEDLEDVLAVSVAHVDVTLCVDRGAA